MANAVMTISEAPDAATPRERTTEANHRIAIEFGQLAALLTKQINSVALEPELLSRQSVLDTLRLHHGRLLGISRLHRAISRQPDQDHVDLTPMLSDLFGGFEATDVFEHRPRSSTELGLTFIDIPRSSASRRPGRNA